MAGARSTCAPRPWSSRGISSWKWPPSVRWAWSTPCWGILTLRPAPPPEGCSTRGNSSGRTSCCPSELQGPKFTRPNVPHRLRVKASPGQKPMRMLSERRILRRVNCQRGYRWCWRRSFRVRNVWRFRSSRRRRRSRIGLWWRKFRWKVQNRWWRVGCKILSKEQRSDWASSAQNNSTVSGT